ncbi:hypothetical protein N7478_010849 [Penicillium angulare]|uniref:uncharacterized protein n=1 Tax=Penicillium angulare TaxID=116970 RepID=UPI0025405299|nr:uncharacterized protein N7478_010849 [Penicillium angulare]KAJ5263244.1 hypothetical protein N7478_010849 [Penicillium angulare]
MFPFPLKLMSQDERIDTTQHSLENSSIQELLNTHLPVTILHDAHHSQMSFDKDDYVFLKLGDGYDIPVNARPNDMAPYTTEIQEVDSLLPRPLILGDELPIHIMMERATGITKDTFVEFSDLRGAENAVRLMNERPHHQYLGGSLVQVHNSSPDSCQAQNKLLLPDLYPLPRQEEIIQLAAGKRYVSIVDAAKFFYHWRVHSDDTQLQAVVSHRDQELINVAIMGSAGSVAYVTYVQRQMDNLLLVFREWCPAYFDDIITVADTFDEHTARLHKNFAAFESRNITLSPEKSRLCFPSLVKKAFENMDNSRALPEDLYVQTAGRLPDASIHFPDFNPRMKMCLIKMSKDFPLLRHVPEELLSFSPSKP